MKINQKNLIKTSAFLSGTCGLAYEVLYNRIFSSIFGDSFAVSFAILSVFLTGIAIGYLIAPIFKKFLYLIETLIGAYSLAIIYLILATKSYINSNFLGIFPAYYPYSIIWTYIFLLIPSILIGSSIPILSKYMQIEKENKPFNTTYFLYNFGAALVILLIEFIIIRLIPLSFIIVFFTLINFFTAFLLYKVKNIYTNEKINKINFSVLKNKKILPLIILCISSSLFQMFLLKASTFVFGPFRENFSLTVFTAIIYIAIGSHIQKHLNICFKKTIYGAFLTISLILIAFKPSVFAVSLILSFCGTFPIFFKITKILWMFFVGVPLLFFGMSVPAFISTYRKNNFLENTSGEVLFASSVGNIIGYSLMFFFLHPHLNYGQILLTIGLISFLSLSLKKIKITKSIVLITFILICFIFWDEKLMYISHRNFYNIEALCNAYSNIKNIETFKAYNQTLAVITRKNGSKSFFINGYHSIQLNNYIEKLVGIIPYIMQDNPTSALVLGLGSGITAGGTSSVIKNLEVVEINKAIIENQKRFEKYNNKIHKNKNVRIIYDDGISYMKKTNQKYDIIINTVTSPLYFSSSKLYTKDFYNIIKKHLSKKGIYYTWFDGRCGDKGAFILIKTILSSFKNAGIISLRSSYFLIFASNSNFSFRKNISKNFINKLKTKIGCPYDPTLCILTSNITQKQTLKYIKNIPVNTIDFPSLEYYMSETSFLPSFFQTKKWISEITEYETHPIEKRRLSEQEKKQRYFYYSVYIPFLIFKARKYCNLTQKDIFISDAKYIYKNLDSSKINKNFAKLILRGLTKNNFSFLKKDKYHNSPLKNKYLKIIPKIFNNTYLMQKKFNKQLIKNYDDEYMHILKSYILLKQNKKKLALKHLLTAIAINPNLIRTRIYLASQIKNNNIKKDLIEFFKTNYLPKHLIPFVNEINSKLKNKVDFSSNKWFNINEENKIKSYIYNINKSYILLDIFEKYF